jgi:hypothetical protein
MALYRWMAVYSTQKALIRSGCSRRRPPICASCGKRWVILLDGMRTLLSACPSRCWEVDPEMASAVQNAVASLRKAGVTCKPVNISAIHAELVTAQRIVAFYEGARFHELRFAEFGDRLGYLAGLVREGLQITDVRYDEARRVIAERHAIRRHTTDGTPPREPALPAPGPPTHCEQEASRREIDSFRLAKGQLFGPRFDRWEQRRIS